MEAAEACRVSAMLRIRTRVRVRKVEAAETRRVHRSNLPRTKLDETVTRSTRHDHGVLVLHVNTYVRVVRGSVKSSLRVEA